MKSIMHSEKAKHPQTTDKALKELSIIHECPRTRKRGKIQIKKDR